MTKDKARELADKLKAALPHLCDGRRVRVGIQASSGWNTNTQIYFVPRGTPMSWYPHLNACVQQCDCGVSGSENYMSLD